jgi:hypothetical protein
LGVKFAKTLDGGTLKNIAFILDPDGYMVEVCAHTPAVSCYVASLCIDQGK